MPECYDLCFPLNPYCTRCSSTISECFDPKFSTSLLDCNHASLARLCLVRKRGAQVSPSLTHCDALCLKPRPEGGGKSLYKWGKDDRSKSQVLPSLTHHPTDVSISTRPAEFLRVLLSNSTIEYDPKPRSFYLELVLKCHTSKL